MAPNKSKTEIWVDDEKDEPAVIDFSIWWDSTAYRPGDAHELDLLVFIDFRRVPFRLTRVDGEPNSEPFPTRQEASTGGGLEKSADLVVPKDIPNAYTLSLPPESLGERGAHDLRIVAFGPPRDENPDWASRRFSFGWKLTVNNGGTAFVARSQIPGSNVPTEIPPKRMLGPLAIVGTALMAPGMTAEEYWEANYANVFEIASDTARLDSWQSGRPGVENFPIAFVTLDGNRVVDGSRWLDQFPAQPEIRDNENLGRIRVPDTPFARNYDVDVPIGDEKVHTIRQIAFAKPFCRHVEPGNFRVTNSVKVRKK